MNTKASCDITLQDCVPSNVGANQSILKIGDLFSLLGSDPEANIRIIVQQVCEILGSACSLYSRVNEADNSFFCWAGYNLPPDFPPRDKPQGHICFEATMRGGNQPVTYEDLTKTPYYHSDPYVQRYGLKSYLGYPVNCAGETIGSLCVVDTRTRRFDRSEIYLMCTLAKAISLEEERKKVESALRLSEKKYEHLYKMMRLLTDNVPDLIWAKDLDDRYMFANQALCDNLLKCARPEEAIGRTELEFAQRERAAGQQHTFGEIAHESDAIVKRKRCAGRFVEEGLVRNQTLVLDVHKAPFWDEDGEILGTVGCARDVTKEKQTEKALRAGERRYRNLYNNTPVMLFSMDRDDRLISVSNLWLETMGFQRDEVIGHFALDFFDSESRRFAVQAAMPAFYKSGQMRNVAFRLVTKGGEFKEILLSAIAERDEEGRYAGALAFVVDLTDVKRAESDTKRLTTRLQQAQKMEAIATLAGGIAHQFNNALAVILGNLELIQMDGLCDQKQLRFIEPINQAGQKMVQLTSQLLAYARGGKFQTQVVPAQHFVRDALRLVGHSMAPCVDLETELDPATDFIEVDPTQMQMLLAAILSNASEAITENGRVRISLCNSAVTEEDCQKCPGLRPRRMVRMRISDSGKGMDEETRARIFEPFYTTKFTGRGLGMAAVYGIVKKHGGYIYVDSEPDQGTTVTIYLPPAQPPHLVSQETPLYSPRHTGTALIVEDEHLVMEVSRAIVEKLGYRVLEAKSGREALRIAQTYEGRIDFALLDVILPDMGGNQIYPLLMEARPDLKVIVCSGYALNGPAKEIMNAGAHSFIQKPFGISILSNTLKQIFSDQGGQQGGGGVT
jgi:PAS domain S-box-containing protein